MNKKEQIIEEGIIKVAWIGKSNKILSSKMFNSIKDAIKFSRGKKYVLIFRLIEHKKMREFKWKLLNYGKAEEFFQLFKAYKTWGLDKIIKFF